jgi:hypothetical protein
MGVKCEHAFWDREGKERTYYEPGEFERLYKEGLTIEVHYKGGMNRVEVDTLPMLLKHLEARHEGSALQLGSIERAPGGASVTIMIEDTGGQDPATLVKDLQTEAESAQKALREKEKQLELVEHELSVLYKKVFPMLLEKTKVSGDKQISVGNIGDISNNAKATVDQSVHYSQNDLVLLKDLVTEILVRLPQLEPDLAPARLAELKASLKAIQSQLSQKTADQSLIKKSLGGAKRILEGATANALASGWLKVLEGLA